MSNETKAIKEYIAYIPIRLAYLKLYKVKPTHNEYKFYLELYKSIKEYGNSHKPFLYYVIGRINIEKLSTFYKVSERTAFRIYAKQRKEFISFLQGKETELLIKYPFENGLDIKEMQG